MWSSAMRFEFRQEHPAQTETLFMLSANLIPAQSQTSLPLTRT